MQQDCVSYLVRTGIANHFTPLYIPYSLLRLIRLSSPNLNYIIGGGAFLLYAAVYLTVIPTTDRDIISATCNVCITSWARAAHLACARLVLWVCPSVQGLGRPGKAKSACTWFEFAGWFASSQPRSEIVQ